MRVIRAAEAGRIAQDIQTLAQSGQLLKAARLADKACKSNLPRGFYQRFFPQKRSEYLARMLSVTAQDQRDAELLHEEGTRLLRSAQQMLFQGNAYGAGNFAARALPFLKQDSPEAAEAWEVISRSSPPPTPEAETKGGDIA